MKDVIRTIARKLVKNKYGWAFLSPIVRLGNYLDFQKNQSEFYINLANLYERLKKILEYKPIVRNGPFKGMRYPSFDAYGSAMFPKIIGSYEREIHFLIEEICKENYSTIMDIGSAEGYYAIGFAYRIPHAKVFAFDINRKANEFCKNMAELNHVEDRVIIGDFCSSETLRNFDFSNKSFIVCDTDGYEKILFDKSNINNLKKCSLLIEVHDYEDIFISEYLENLFKDSHRIIKVKSSDDIDKAKQYIFPETESLSLEERKLIFRESRPAIMEWFFMRPKIEEFN